MATLGIKNVTVAALSLTGFVGGILTEKYRPRFFGQEQFSLASFNVNAAKPLPKDLEDTPDSKWVSEGPPKQKLSRVSEIMKYGFPGMDNIRSFDDFVLSYDRRNRVPHWVFEHLTRHSTKPRPDADRGKCEFFEDSSVHPYFRSTSLDYKGSGYDRGHMAAAGNHRMEQRLMEETFVLSNMAPQVGKGFNRDTWNRLEKYVRGLTKRYDNVYVCTGPLYLPRREENGKYYVKYEVIGKNNVAVPTHFYKVIVGEHSTGQVELESYIMPNKPIDDSAPLDAFRVPIDAVERAAGLLFFDRIPKGSYRQINGRRV